MTIELGKKTYSVEGVALRALAEMDDAWDMYIKLAKASAGGEAGSASFQQVISSLAKWIVILFGNQFTLDELLDNYPADRFIADTGLMLQGVAGRVTGALGAFPTRARPQAEEKADTATLHTESTKPFWRRAGHRRK